MREKERRRNERNSTKTFSMVTLVLIALLTPGLVQNARADGGAAKVYVLMLPDVGVCSGWISL